MDGIAAAGALTVAPRAAGPLASSARSFVIEVAVPPGRGPKASPCDADDRARQDDEAIRRLLRESVFGGEVGLSLEREPDSFAAAAIEGDVHQTIVARDSATGRVIATAGRAVRDAYVNGRSVRLGYLGQLRIDPAYRRRRLLDEGFALLRALHDTSPACAYLLAIVADNAPARTVLERRRPGWPAVGAVDRFVTLAIAVSGAASPTTRASVETVRGSDVGAAAIVEYLSRSSRRHQFSPRWSAHDLESPERTRDLTLDDFVVAIRRGVLVGCVACWDQRAFRQVVVRRYSRRLRLLRRVINLTAPVTGVPRLPRVGARVESAFLSHLAVDDDDPEVFETLVRAGCRLGRRKGVESVALGLPHRGLLLARARRSFAHRAYESILYLACWPGCGPGPAELDGRPSNPELAIL